MLYTIAALLIVLWLVGLVSGYMVGGWIHFLLIVAVIMAVSNFLSKRKRSAGVGLQAEGRKFRRDSQSPKTWELK